MKSNTFRLHRSITVLAMLLLSFSVVARAQGTKVKEGAEQASKAVTVLKEIANAPDKGVPADVFAKANCVAVFPGVVKAGLIVGARGGRGLASCRTASGWSAPGYFDIGGGSFGLQIGASATDFIFFFMNEKAMDSLLSSKFTMGGEASVAAGPVGRQTGAETDALMNAQILSYSRSKGVFGGLELKGTVISADKSLNEDVYGKAVGAKDILKMPAAKAPTEVQVFPQALAGYSARREAKGN